MKRYSPEELAEVLRLHGLWREDDPSGVRANLAGANLVRANLDGANLDGANLDGANLVGAHRIFSLEAFSGLYKYECWAFATVEGVSWVRMGCLWKTVEDWDKIGIRNSNLREFPDNGSETSERRARAFDFARAAAISLAEKAKANPLKLAPGPQAPVSKGNLVQLSDAARERWPWAPTGEGRVDAVMNGWILIEYPERYLRAPYDFVVPAASATKKGVPA